MCFTKLQIWILCIFAVHIMDATSDPGGELADEGCSTGDTILSCPDGGHILLTGVTLIGQPSQGSGKGPVIIYCRGGPESKVSRRRKYFEVKRVAIKKKKKKWKAQSRRRNTFLRKILSYLMYFPTYFSLKLA